MRMEDESSCAVLVINGEPRVTAFVEQQSVPYDAEGECRAADICRR